MDLVGVLENDVLEEWACKKQKYAKITITVTNEITL
jgi:hypothetical protein